MFIMKPYKIHVSKKKNIPPPEDNSIHKKFEAYVFRFFSMYLSTCIMFHTNRLSYRRLKTFKACL